MLAGGRNRARAQTASVLNTSGWRIGPFRWPLEGALGAGAALARTAVGVGGSVSGDANLIGTRGLVFFLFSVRVFVAMFCGACPVV